MINVSKVMLCFNIPRGYFYFNFILPDGFNKLPVIPILDRKIMMRPTFIGCLFYYILPYLNLLSPDVVSIIGGKGKPKQQAPHKKRVDLSVFCHIPILISTSCGMRNKARFPRCS